MNPPTNEHVDIAGYLMEMLSPEEKQLADEHLSRCPECRAEVDSMQDWAGALRNVPEEMLLDGPPDDADLLLQRTLRQVRQESRGARLRRRLVVGAAAAAVLWVAIAGGVVIGQSTAPNRLSAAPATSEPAGTVTHSITDQDTHAQMVLTVMPAAGWVRLHATVKGVPAGEKCTIEVVAKDGTTVPAGSWLVSPAGEKNGTTLDGSAFVDPAQVKSVRVVDQAGKTYIDAPV